MSKPLKPASRRSPALYRKVGGIHFVRVWRLQFMFCLCRPAKRAVRTRPIEPIRQFSTWVDPDVWVGPDGVRTIMVDCDR